MQGDPLWRALAAASVERICRTFPCRTGSTKGRAMNCCSLGWLNICRDKACSMPRATGGPVALLPSGGSVKEGHTSEIIDLNVVIHVNNLATKYSTE